jgi:hypothetical protein
MRGLTRRQLRKISFFSAVSRFSLVNHAMLSHARQKAPDLPDRQQYGDIHNKTLMFFYISTNRFWQIM